MHYLVCGMSVASEMPLPATYRADPSAEPDVVIRFGNVPDQLDNPDYAGPLWSVAGRRFLLNTPGVLRLLVQDGREIIVEAVEGVEATELAPFVMSTGLGGLLHQRGVLALHAATVMWRGRAVAICGETGMGKSTMAAALCQAGARFIGDDIAAIRLGAGDEAWVSPDGRQHRLWSDAISHLKLTDRQDRPVRSHLSKFHVRPERSVEEAGGSLPLGAIVLLHDRSREAPPGPPEIARLQLADALPLLRAQVHKPSLAERMGLVEHHFTQLARLLAHVEVLRIERTRSLDRLNEDAELLLAKVSEGG